jgi:ribosome-binding factor A
MKQRALRIAQIIKEVVGELLLTGLRDPRIGFVSISDVEVSGDLRLVKIFISAMGTEAEKKASLQGLESAKGMIRSVIGKSVSLRYTPDVLLIADESIARGSELIDLMSKVIPSKEDKS